MLSFTHCNIYLLISHFILCMFSLVLSKNHYKANYHLEQQQQANNIKLQLCKLQTNLYYYTHTKHIQTHTHTPRRNCKLLQDKQFCWRTLKLTISHFKLFFLLMSLSQSHSRIKQEKYCAHTTLTNTHSLSYISLSIYINKLNTVMLILCAFNCINTLALAHSLTLSLSPLLTELMKNIDL